MERESYARGVMPPFRIRLMYIQFMHQALALAGSFPTSSFVIKLNKQTSFYDREIKGDTLVCPSVPCQKDNKVCWSCDPALPLAITP